MAIYCQSTGLPQNHAEGCTLDETQNPNTISKKTFSFKIVIFLDCSAIDHCEKCQLSNDGAITKCVQCQPGFSLLLEDNNCEGELFSISNRLNHKWDEMKRTTDPAHCVLPIMVMSSKLSTHILNSTQLAQHLFLCFLNSYMFKYQSGRFSS